MSQPIAATSKADQPQDKPKPARKPRKTIKTMFKTMFQTKAQNKAQDKAQDKVKPVVKKMECQICCALVSSLIPCLKCDLQICSACLKQTILDGQLEPCCCNCKINLPAKRKADLIAGVKSDSATYLHLIAEDDACQSLSDIIIMLLIRYLK